MSDHDDVTEAIHAAHATRHAHRHAIASLGGGWVPGAPQVAALPSLLGGQMTATGNPPPPPGSDDDNLQPAQFGGVPSGASAPAGGSGAPAGGSGG